MLCSLGVPDTQWILRISPPCPLKLSQAVLRLGSEVGPWSKAPGVGKPRETFSQVHLRQNPNHHSLLSQDLLLGAEVKGLPTFHHLPELLPQLPKLHLSQLLFFLL